MLLNGKKNINQTISLFPQFLLRHTVVFINNKEIEKSYLSAIYGIFSRRLGYSLFHIVDYTDNNYQYKKINFDGLRHQCAIIINNTARAV